MMEWLYNSFSKLIVAPQTAEMVNKSDPYYIKMNGIRFSNFQFMDIQIVLVLLGRNVKTNFQPYY